MGSILRWSSPLYEPLWQYTSRRMFMCFCLSPLFVCLHSPTQNSCISVLSTLLVLRSSPLCLCISCFLPYLEILVPAAGIITAWWSQVGLLSCSNFQRDPVTRTFSDLYHVKFAPEDDVQGLIAEKLCFQYQNQLFLSNIRNSKEPNEVTLVKIS